MPEELIKRGFDGAKLSRDMDALCLSFFESVCEGAEGLGSWNHSDAFAYGAGGRGYPLETFGNEQTMFYGMVRRTLSMIAGERIGGCSKDVLGILLGFFLEGAQWESVFPQGAVYAMWGRFRGALRLDNPELVQLGEAAMPPLTRALIPERGPEDITEANETWYYTAQAFQEIYVDAERNGFCYPQGQELIRDLTEADITLFADMMANTLLRIDDGGFEYYPTRNLLAMLCCLGKAGEPEDEPNGDSGERTRGPKYNPWLFASSNPGGGRDALPRLRRIVANSLVRVIEQRPLSKQWGGEHVEILRADAALGFLDGESRGRVVMSCIRDGYGPELFYDGEIDFDEFFGFVKVFLEEQGAKPPDTIYGNLANDFLKGVRGIVLEMEKNFFQAMRIHVNENAEDIKPLKKHLSLIKSGVVDLFRYSKDKKRPEPEYQEYLKTLSLSLENHRSKEREAEPHSVEVSF